LARRHLAAAGTLRQSASEFFHECAWRKQIGYSRLRRNLAPRATPQCPFPPAPISRPRGINDLHQSGTPPVFANQRDSARHLRKARDKPLQLRPSFPHRRLRSISVGDCLNARMTSTLFPNFSSAVCCLGDLAATSGRLDFTLSFCTCQTRKNGNLSGSRML
jgi:hypothetical protein